MKNTSKPKLIDENIIPILVFLFFILKISLVTESLQL